MVGPNIFEAARSIERAEYGDISLIVDRLRAGKHLSNEERNFLADLIERKRTLPPRRVPSLEKEIRDSELVVAYLFELSISIVINPAQKVAGMFEISTKHLHRIHDKVRSDAPRYEQLRRRAARLTKNFLELEKAVAEIREARSDAARQLWAERRARRSSDRAELGE